MEKYGLHGKLTAKSGKGNELAGILLEASKLVSKAKGCQLYLVSTDPTEENMVWITEVWDSQEDHDNSLKMPGVRELIGKAIPILDGPPTQGQKLLVKGGFGVN